jgi:hypothetical protein
MAGRREKGSGQKHAIFLKVSQLRGRVGIYSARILALVSLVPFPLLK